LGLGRTALEAHGRATVAFESKGLVYHRLICPDGTSYADDVEGSCPDVGARWLCGGLPGYDLA
jgi:hypothetical protein